MGVLISVNGWSSNVVVSLKENANKRVLLMNGEDIRAVLANDIALTDMLRAKIKALNLKSEPFFGAPEILAQANS